MSNLILFEHHQYMNMETFRKNRVGVKTLVWFVQDENTLYVRTGADSGKVKRIRNNTNVNIVPCKVDGTPLAEWLPANARVVKDNNIDKKVDRLLGKKYGLMKVIYSLGSELQGSKYTILEIKVRI